MTDILDQIVCGYTPAGAGPTPVISARRMALVSPT